MPQQAFEVTTSAGVIRGMAYLAESGGRRPTVMMCHGFTGNRIESGFLFVRLGRALAEAGVNAVSFDFLNSGESDGSFEKMRVSQEIRDAGAVAHWLEGQPFVDRSRLGGLGFSLGGLVVSGAHRQRGGFAALGLLAPTTAENLQRVAGDTGGREAVTVGPYELPPAFFEDLASCDTTSDAASPVVPTLLVQGTEDQAVPVEVSAKYARAIEAAGGEVQRVMVEGASHVFGEPTHQQRAVEAVASFFREKLGR